MPSWDIRFDLLLDFKDEPLIVALAQADALASVIRQVPLTPLVQERLNRLNIVRAVHGTTAIEGGNLSEADVGHVMSSASPALGPGRRVDETEARNADAAMRYIADLLDKNPLQPLTEDLVRQLNRLLTEGVESPKHMPGRYRTIGVSAGTYEAPRPDLVVPLMSRFIAWLDSDEIRGWRPLARAVAAHFYFVSIHPFADGNGRTARAIESFLLYQSGASVLGFYSLANFYYRNRSRYMRLLDEVRFEAESLTPSVLFAAEGLVEELRAIHTDVMRYVSGLVRRNLTEETLANAKLSTKTRERMSRLVAYLDREPVQLRSLRAGTHPLSAFYVGASMRTLERDLDALEKLGLLKRQDAMLYASENVPIV